MPSVLKDARQRQRQKTGAEHQRDSNEREAELRHSGIDEEARPGDVVVAVGRCAGSDVERKNTRNRKGEARPVPFEWRDAGIASMQRLRWANRPCPLASVRGVPDDGEVSHTVPGAPVAGSTTRLLHLPCPSSAFHTLAALPLADRPISKRQAGDPNGLGRL